MGLLTKRLYLKKNNNHGARLRPVKREGFLTRALHDSVCVCVLIFSMRVLGIYKG